MGGTGSALIAELLQPAPRWVSGGVSVVGIAAWKAHPKLR